MRTRSYLLRKAVKEAGVKGGDERIFIPYPFVEARVGRRMYRLEGNQLIETATPTTVVPGGIATGANAQPVRRDTQSDNRSQKRKNDSSPATTAANKKGRGGGSTGGNTGAWKKKTGSDIVMQNFIRMGRSPARKQASTETVSSQIANVNSDEEDHFADTVSNNGDH
jgi:hypothetical protein